MNRRIILALLASITLLGNISCKQKPYPPLFHPFDASRGGEETSFDFEVKDHRYYKIVLRFAFRSPSEATNLHHLLDDDEALFIFDEQSNTTRKITGEFFLSPSDSTFPRDRDAALNEAVIKYNEAVQHAIFQSNAGGPTTFLYLPQKTEGQIPLEIALYELLPSSQPLLANTYRASSGFESGGNGEFVRNVWGYVLNPGRRYRIKIRTVSDSPRFKGVPTDVGITFDSRLSKFN